MTDQFVLVTHYQPPEEGKRPVVHVWGPYPTRNKTLAAQQRMRRDDADRAAVEPGEVRYWVRPIRDPDHP